MCFVKFYTGGVFFIFFNVHQTTRFPWVKTIPYLFQHGLFNHQHVNILNQLPSDLKWSSKFQVTWLHALWKGRTRHPQKGRERKSLEMDMYILLPHFWPHRKVAHPEQPETQPTVPWCGRIMLHIRCLEVSAMVWDGFLHMSNEKGPLVVWIIYGMMNYPAIQGL